MPDKRLLLLDGNNVLYRAFFAIAGLSTKSGRPTNAVFGFIRMLRQMERLWRPTHWAAVFDGGTPKERLDLLDTYKANRAPMPDALREQFAPVEQYLDASRVCRLRVDGCEADDVIATLATTAARAGMETLIATSDKDMFQIVTERIGIVSPAKSDVKLGPNDVLQKTGVAPARIVEWLALTGDSADNIPGVPGIGPKTAAQLLTEYPLLDEILITPEKIRSERLRNLLAGQGERVRRNLKLVSLRCDLTGLPSLPEMEVRPSDDAKLLPLFEELEFHSMADELRTATLF